MQKKKILFLTLGSGNISADSDDAAYRQTNYKLLIDNEEIEYKSNFAAEPIISSYRPDEIFILGTVKSVWHQLYASFITESNDDRSYMEDTNYKALIDIVRDKNLGWNTEDEVLADKNKKIQACFDSLKEKGSCKRIDGIESLNIKILLTKYGVNEDQLKDNYSIIKSIENTLDINEEYEVAFDITHSFRSLPLYNLVIFNYIKNVTAYNLKLKHIYYGNLDVSRELGYAPIVDLKDLVDILELTSGVAEFRNTGNANSLLSMIKDEEQAKLKDCLKEFDVSTQLNTFSKIKQNLNELVCICNDTSGGDNRYTGIREMIHEVLKNKFLNGRSLEELNLSNTDNDTDLKFLLTEWYFNQGRIGLGLATGLEALRDLNTPIFVAAKDLQVQNLVKIRENAEKYFIDIANSLNDKDESQRSDLEKIVYELGVNLNDYKEIRNIFAHSLEKEIIDIENLTSQISKFRNDLKELKEQSQIHYNEYLSMFSNSQIGKSSAAKTSKCRLIMDFSKPDPNSNVAPDSNTYRALVNSTQCDLYWLEENVRKVFLVYNNISKRGKPYFNMANAYYLYRYLVEKIPSGYTEVDIALVNIPNNNKDIEVGYRILFEKIEEQIKNQKINVLKSNNQNYKKLGIPIDMNQLEKQFGDQLSKYIGYDDYNLESSLVSQIQSSVK